jgi:hypothetical protein
MKTVLDSLKKPISTVRCWSDSTVVLGRLNPEKKLPVFELNRVRKIISIFPKDHWGHVDGLDNPADCASRGISASELLNHPLWLHGPVWLREATVSYPAVHTASILDPVPSPITNLIANCSVLGAMQRRVAYCLRFLKNCKLEKKARSLGTLSTVELDSALTTIIKLVQAEEFPTEISSCKTLNPVKSKIKFLTPFIDKNELIRVGGRLDAASVSYEKKHPILLPKKHNFVTVLARQYHRANLHAGPQLLISLLRERYWIVRVNDLVKKTVKNCVVCHKHTAVPVTQLMGQYPPARVNPAPTFSQTGVDYAGPFVLALRTGRKAPIAKYHSCLFVCMATKAIHLEPVSDLTTPAFIAAFTRFIGRRGKPSDIFCDGGTNFLGAKNELNEVQALLRSQAHRKAMEEYAVSQGISFHVNPPAAPHHGGLWEAGVKSMKKHLRRVMGSQTLTVEEFSTLLCQVEAILNSRPITPVSTDPNDMTALTPGHFIIGKPLVSIPQADVTHLKQNHLSRSQAVQQMTQHFWKRWSSEYLTLLHSRPKWLHPLPNLDVGLLVLIQNDDGSLGPQQWKLGRIIRVYPGPDGKTRVCDVRTNVTMKNPKGTILKRPVVKLSPLPIYN